MSGVTILGTGRCLPGEAVNEGFSLAARPDARRSLGG